MATCEGRQVAGPVLTRSSPGQPTWDNPGARDRGFPAPGSGLQRRPPGDMTPQGIVPFGVSKNVISPEFSRGAMREVQFFGTVLTNPIGAGRLVKGRIKPQNSKPGNYQAGAIWWTAQAAPTTVRLTGLQNAQALAAVLGPNYVQAVVRTTG